MSKKKIIIGAGSAGRAALSILHAMGVRNIAFLDDSLVGSNVNGTQVIDKVYAWSKYRDAEFILAFGTLDLVKKIHLYNEMLHKGGSFFNAIHPSANIDEHAILGQSIIVSPNVSVMPNAVIEDGCFICANCSVDHDCILHRGVHLSPGVNLAGRVEIGSCSLLGTNSSVIPEVKIGAYTTVGAGAVVINNIENSKKVAGVPAKDI